MRPIPSVARLQGGVFTVAQAATAGWTRSALRHAVSNGQLLVVRRGILAVPPTPTDLPWLASEARHRIATAAALLAKPGSVASHASVGLLLDIPILDPDTAPCVTVAAGRASELAGVHVHRARLDPPIHLGNLPLTHPALAVVDTAGEHGRAAGLVIADAALGNSLITSADLARALDARQGWLV